MKHGKNVTVALGALLLLLGTAPPSAASTSYHFIRLEYIDVKPTTYKVAEGESVKVKCAFEFGTAYKQGIILLWPAGEGQVYVYPKGETPKGFKKIPGIVPAGAYGANSTIKGAFEATWQATAPGTYKIECGAGTEGIPATTFGDAQVDKPTAYAPFPYQLVTVTAKKQTLGVSPNMAASGSGILPVVAKPNLSVTGVQVKIESYCQAPQPAMTATVTIKNSGGNLPSGKGLVFVKEQGGANLGSAGIQIPAIGAGQTQGVVLPAITSQPYSSLAGAHQVQVILNPASEGGQPSFNKPADAFKFSAVFPSGHCKQGQRQQQVPPRPAPQRRQ